MPLRSKIQCISVIALAAGLYSLPAQAQYVGPSGETGQQNIGAILKNPVDDQNVKLQGHLLRKAGHEKYIFSDGTGEITMEIDDKDFPSQPVDEKTKIEVVGEVDTGLRRPPEIEADSVRILK